MKIIYKYELDAIEEQQIKLPIGYRILKVAEQYGKLCLWAIVTRTNELKDVNVRITGTGMVFSEDREGSWHHLDTVLMSNGFVWHVFHYIKF